MARFRPDFGCAVPPGHLWARTARVHQNFVERGVWGAAIISPRDPRFGRPVRPAANAPGFRFLWPISAAPRQGPGEGPRSRTLLVCGKKLPALRAESVLAVPSKHSLWFPGSEQECCRTRRRQGACSAHLSAVSLHNYCPRGHPRLLRQRGYPKPAGRFFNHGK